MSMGNEQFMSPAEEEFASAPSSFEPQEQQQAPEQQAPQQEAPPFEGFEALPEPIRQKWVEAETQRKKFETDLAQARRETSALKGKVPYLERELAALRKNKPAVAAPASSSAAPMSAEAWEKFKADFPQDAAAFEQALARQAGEISGKLSPIEQQLKEQAERLERFEQMAQQAENEQIQETLDEAVPDWRIIAGWETAEGGQGEGTWHPEFQAWLDSMPNRVRGQYEEALTSRDPDDIAYVINSFKRDYMIALSEEGAAPPQQQQQPTQRRRVPDVMPSATSNALGGGLTGNHREDEYVNAVTSDLWQQWQALTPR
jgi:hypothetical protein